ncbi:MAG TPA: hypothetical protein DCM87_10145 [Planctomycetes bacterium]|nr:hypothetical protein [Planctomycetota bacterium]
MICENRLRSMVQWALLYADDHAGWFPVAEGENPAAHESLQLLVDAFGDECDPEIFVCPASGDVPAVRGVDGKLRLAAGNVSYAWRAKPLRVTETGGGTVVIACDKTLHPQELGGAGVHVAYSGGRVKFLTADELGEGGLDGFLARHELTR